MCVIKSNDYASKKNSIIYLTLSICEGQIPVDRVHKFIMKYRRTSFPSLRTSRNSLKNAN